jgi:hypothetical protein
MWMSIWVIACPTEVIQAGVTEEEDGSPETEGEKKDRFGYRDAIYHVFSENQTAIW